MDYLRSLYNDALAQEQNCYVQDGRIFIRTRSWVPEDILEGLLTKEALDDEFYDWVRERNDDLLSQADEILNRHDQHDRFRILIEAHKRGTVTPFVGAGLSMPSNYPGWTNFLRQLRSQTDIPEALLEQLLETGQYEEVAQQLSDKLRAGFNEAVEAKFGCTRDLVGPVQFLPYVFDTCVVTTNFDDVLKRCYDNAQRSFTDVIPGNQADELPRYLGAGKKVLLKLHGTSTTGRGRILTANEYLQYYGDGLILKRAIEAICARTLLFIGCNLTVDRVLGVIKNYVDTNGHDNVSRHYAFLEEPPTDVERFTRRDKLLECNIYPIWYPAEQHDDSIEALLVKLREGVK